MGLDKSKVGQTAELTDEQKARFRACRSSDELLQRAEDEGIKLTDEQLEGIQGGGWFGCSDDDCKGFIS